MVFWFGGGRTVLVRFAGGGGGRPVVDWIGGGGKSVVGWIGGGGSVVPEGGRT